uniref:Uncharacterized protein n=1 Tax=Rhizophora mucronata TaxID=61149 RepID=A0A2P2LVS1_RHIMU
MGYHIVAILRILPGFWVAMKTAVVTMVEWNWSGGGGGRRRRRRRRGDGSSHGLAACAMTI